MAKNKCTVLLGYDDEPIADKDKPYLSHAVNKIGGTPNWPASEIAVAPCPLCGQARPLILQIYAPLENSQFHRTLYIFACLNAPCSTQSPSWFCVRTQSLEKSPGGGVGDNYETASNQQVVKTVGISWCSGADEWDDDDGDGDDAAGGGDGAGDTIMRVDTGGGGGPDVNDNEENGNVIRWDNKISDEEEESNSLENDPVPGFGDLRVDERNANDSGARGGLIDNLYTSKVTAEIEGTEEDVVAVETPVTPKRDLIALLKQPQIISRDVRDLTLKSFYISVDEERSFAPDISEHVRELLHEYQKHEDVKTSPDSPVGHGAVGGQQPVDQEMYEKGVPAHGDLMFHNFMTKLQENPGQILRYSRTAAPILIAPLKELVVPPVCQHCKNEMICEIQILPTIIEKLCLEATGQQVPIDFGNVLVWTCIKSCWDTPDRMRSEMVLVQQES